MAKSSSNKISIISHKIFKIGHSILDNLFQWVRGNKLLVLLILVAFIWAIGASATLFPYYSVNNDEAVYVLEANTLLEGRLTLPVTPFDHFTQPRFVYPLGDKNVFMYSHVFPAFLALGKLIFGSMRVVLGLIAAIAVGGMYALVYELYRDRTAALIAAGMLLTSPLFLLHSATYLPYTFLLMMAIVFWTLSAHGLRQADQKILFCAGVIAGLTFWARPLNGVIIVLPVAAAVVFLPWKDFRSFAKYAGMLLLGLLPVLSLIMIYNHYLTGNPLYFPQMAFDRFTIPDVGSDFLSFDSTGMQEATSEAIKGTQNLITWFQSTLSSLKGWTFGSWLAWIPILYILFTKYMSRQTILVISFLWLHPLIFFILGFYDMTPQLLQEFGPIYSIPMLIPMITLIALGTVALFRKWRYITAFIIIGMLALNWISLKPKFTFHYSETEFYHDLYQPLFQEDIQNGLVFIPIVFEETILHPFGYLMNTPMIDGNVVYALDRGAENIDFIRQYPNRDIYQFSLLEMSQGDLDTAKRKFISKSFLTKLQMKSAKSITEEIVITNPTSKQYVFIGARNEALVEEYLLDNQSEMGNTYQISWTFEDGNLEFEGDYIESTGSSIESLSNDPYFSIMVGFASTREGEDIEVFEYRYDYQVSDDEILNVILPPEAFYYEDQNFGRMEDISAVINRIETD